VKLNLLDIPLYYINLDRDVEKKNKTESLLRELGFRNAYRFPGVPHNDKITGCALSHYHILRQAKPPFIILEDDCELYGEFKSEIDIPDDTDALYLGISHWGRYLNHSGPYVHIDPVKDGIVRVYNMLATHAIMYLSNPYVDICRRIGYHYGCDVNGHLDSGFAEVHKLFKVYAFDEPIFKQSDWSSITSGKLSSFAYNKESGDRLFKDARSSITHLNIKDVNGNSGYFLPERLI